MQREGGGEKTDSGLQDVSAERYLLSQLSHKYFRLQGLSEQIQRCRRMAHKRLEAV